MIQPPADADDLEAIRAVLAGDQRAFGRLVDKYGGSIFNLTRRMTGNAADADELTQETFLRAYAHLADFRVGSRVHPWLFTIALNLCRNHLRRRSLLRWLPLETVAGSSSSAPFDVPERRPNPEQELLAQESEAELGRALAALPAKYREVFLLRQAEGLTYAEIAEVTGLPLGTVEVRLFRARRLLLRALARGDRPGAK